MVDEDRSQHQTHKTNETPKSEKKSEESEGVKVRLVAKSWQRQVPGSNPVKYKRHNQGDVLTVSEKEFEALNTFKTSVVKVDE